MANSPEISRKIGLATSAATIGIGLFAVGATAMGQEKQPVQPANRVFLPAVLSRAVIPLNPPPFETPSPSSTPEESATATTTASETTISPVPTNKTESPTTAATQTPTEVTITPTTSDSPTPSPTVALLQDRLLFAALNGGSDHDIFYQGPEGRRRILGTGQTDWEPWGFGDNPDQMMVGYTRRIVTPNLSQVWVKYPDGHEVQVTESLNKPLCYESDGAIGATGVVYIDDGAIYDVSLSANQKADEPRLIAGKPQETKVYRISPDTLLIMTGDGVHRENEKTGEIEVVIPSENVEYKSVDKSLTRTSAVYIYRGTMGVRIFNQPGDSYFDVPLPEGLRVQNAVHLLTQDKVFFVATFGGVQEIWSYDFKSQKVEKAVTGLGLMDPGRISPLDESRIESDFRIVTAAADATWNGDIVVVDLYGNKTVVSAREGYKRSPRLHR